MGGKYNVQLYIFFIIWKKTGCFVEETATGCSNAGAPAATYKVLYALTHTDDTLSMSVGVRFSGRLEELFLL